MLPVDPALEVKLGALVVLLSVTLGSGLAPLCILQGAHSCCLNPGVRRPLLALMGCFAAGVFLASCLLELLPDYLQDIHQAFSSAGITLQFPLPEFILVMGFFLVLVLEQMVLAFREHSVPQKEEWRPLMVDASSTIDRPLQRVVDAGSLPGLRTFLLLFSLCLQAALQGAGLQGAGLQGAGLQLFLQVALHRSLLAFSLVCALAQAQLRRAVLTSCLLLYVIMTPLGVAVGGAVGTAVGGAESLPPHRLARCTLQGLAAGTFIYVTFMDVLPQQLRAGGNHIPRAAMMLLGFAAVTALLFIRL